MEDEFGFKIISFVGYDPELGLFEVLEPELYKKVILKYCNNNTKKTVFEQMARKNILHFINKPYGSKYIQK